MFFLAALFTYFPPRTCWFLLKLYRAGNHSSDSFKHCFCVNNKKKKKKREKERAKNVLMKQTVRA